MKERTAEVGSVQSLEVRMTNSNVLLHNTRFLKHNVKSLTFKDSDDKADHEDMKHNDVDQAEEFLRL